MLSHFKVPFDVHVLRQKEMAGAAPRLLKVVEREQES